MIEVKGRRFSFTLPSGANGPENFAAFSLGTAIELSWDAVATATNYKLYRNTVNNESTALLINTSNELEYVDIARAASTTYYYWVSAIVASLETTKTPIIKSTGAFRTDIILPGTLESPTGFYNPPGQNLMTTYGLSPGDVIVLQAGYYDQLYFTGYFDDITITSGSTGTVNILGFVNFGPEGKHHKLVGNMAANKNIVINSGLDGYFASSSRASGSIYYRNLDLQDNFMGIQVEHRDNTDLEYPSYLLDYQDLTIRDVNIDGTGQEAMYIGSNIVSDHQIYGVIRDCTVANCGRDGIQCRNGIFTIDNNTVTNVGTNAESAHGHGILYGGGGGSTNINEKTYITNNTVSDAEVYGIFANGYGYVWIEGNNIQSNTESAIYCKNYESNSEDILNIGFQHFTIKDNSLNTTDPSSPLSIDIRRDPVKCPVTVDLYSDNTLSDGVYIEDGVNGPNNGITTNNL